MRMVVEDKPGVLSKIADNLGRNNVSIAQVVQKNKIDNLAELVVITHQVREQNLKDALADIKKLDITKEISAVIRVY